jgi:hypothetical protein
MVAIMMIPDMERRADLRALLAPLSRDFLAVIDVACRERMKIGGFKCFKASYLHDERTGTY